MMISGIIKKMLRDNLFCFSLIVVAMIIPNITLGNHSFDSKDFDEEVKHTEAIESEEFTEKIVVKPHKHKAYGFFKDAKWDGHLYYWQRHRTQYNSTADNYDDNLSQSIVNASIDFSSGYVEEIFGLDVSLYSAVSIADKQSANEVHELAFSGLRFWDTLYDNEKDGVSFYTANFKFQHNTEDYQAYAKLGFTPMNAGVLGVNWTYFPGTYRGVETEVEVVDTTINYAFVDQYKAPWYVLTDEFRMPDGVTKINYLQTIGLRQKIAEKSLLELGVGHAQGYMTNFFFKAQHGMDITANIPLFSDGFIEKHTLDVSYQFYGSQDSINDGGVNDMYDGFAWQQAFTIGYVINKVSVRLEGTWTRAKGKNGYYLPRLTKQYGSSNGRYDIWWDARSDWNHDNEKAVFVGIWYDFYEGWNVGTSFVYGWDGLPNSNATGSAENARLTEHAWNFDLAYTVQSGDLKGATIKLHYTDYRNTSGQPAFSTFGNAFPSQKDIKFMVTVPIF
jgi:hypothetical protein